jgi:hypothetical protein
MKIPTAHSSESLERFLQHIQDAPVPVQVSRPYLKQSGFVSGNDPELRHIFRLLGFLNNNDEPQERWLLYKERGEEMLREAILECYKDLFTIFPETPYSRSDTELATWFHPPRTGETRSAMERAIRTFRKLCQLAGMAPNSRAKRPNKSEATSKINGLYPTPSTPGAAQLIFQLPILKDKTDYIDLFEALKQVFYE